MVLKMKLKDPFIIGVLQFLNWGLCTISCRATSQANIMACIMTDTLLTSFNFFLYRKIAKGADEGAFIPWLFYTIGGLCGTVVGILLSIKILGR